MSNSDDPSGWRPAPEPGGTTPPPPPPDPAWRDAPPPPPPPSADAGQPAGAWGQPPQQGWGQPPPQGWGNQYGGYAAPQQTETSAIVALVLACAAWVACPLITAIIALAMVPSARTKIRESNGRLTGEGLLTATKIIAWIHLGLFIAGFAFFAFVIFVGALSSSTGY